MKSYLDCYTLNNGMQLPCMGFGTSNSKGSEEENLNMIRAGIAAGFRYFDTASLYKTERGLAQAMQESALPRTAFQLASKAWIDEMGYKGVQAAFARSLERLHTDYLDLYLLHWPRRTEGDTDWRQLDLDSWKALEELHAAGKIRALGVSNFLPHHLDNLLAHCTVKPVVDQLELHVGYSQEAAVAYCLAQNIRPEAWSPLGRSRGLLELSVLQEMSARYGKSVPQLCLRFLIQKGIIPLPRASSVAHCQNDQDVFDFSLSQEDIWMLSCMPQTTWLGEHPDFAIPKKGSDPNQ